MAGRSRIPLWIKLWLIGGSATVPTGIGLYGIYRKDATEATREAGKQMILLAIGATLFWTLNLWLISKY